MLSRVCTVCGTKVELPRKRDGKGSTEVKCPSCGAVAPLRIKLRNGNVGGLKGCFVDVGRYFNTNRRTKIR